MEKITYRERHMTDRKTEIKKKTNTKSSLEKTTENNIKKTPQDMDNQNNTHFCLNYTSFSKLAKMESY